ncbi:MULTISPECIES: hypothetical protein [unclassified Mesobacillus]|nr:MULTISPECIES: hypothetical protein [unclassified Mesobacillus]MCM3126117.1 hypothetical protein [Mesobacillus sp. MER 33]MCM3236081.1 hypothetical protein [Mesobacillus sp. MER 48]
MDKPEEAIEHFDQVIANMEFLDSLTLGEELEQLEKKLDLDNLEIKIPLG